MRSDLERLQDIWQGINLIAEYTVSGKQSFAQNQLIQSGVLYQIIIIGEAAGDLSADLRSRHPEIPWRQIIGMRNLVSHEYFRVDLEVVWLVVERDLPKLKLTVEAILQELGEDDNRDK